MSENGFRECKYNSKHQDLLRSILGCFPKGDVKFRYDQDGLVHLLFEKQAQYAILLGDIQFFNDGHRSEDISDAIRYMQSNEELQRIGYSDNFLYRRGRSTWDLLKNHPHKSELEKLSEDFQRQFKVR